jgi:protocatechuate 3,4-dioxygenase beta subunit
MNTRAMRNRIAVGVLLFLTSTAIVLGQNQRSVQGRVLDSNGNPLEGAVVKIKDTRTLQVRSFITQADGRYYFYGLSPDVDYELRATYKDASSPVQKLSAFDSRKQATIDLKVK